MSAQASFTFAGRNPDLLSCLANLSNDEVFTPPEFANRMLDTLSEAWAQARGKGGANIWADKTDQMPIANIVEVAAARNAAGKRVARG